MHVWIAEAGKRFFNKDKAIIYQKELDLIEETQTEYDVSMAEYNVKIR